MTKQIGSLVIDIAGAQLTAEDREILAHPCVGGVILFKRNYENKHQLKSLCAAIRETRSDPILIMADQEGGRVQRFLAEFTKIPASANFGKAYEQDPAATLELVESTAWLLASELLEVGVDLSLSPVADLQKMNLAIGDRAYHSDPKITSILSLAWMRGLHEAGMSAVAKHFPGHGSVLLDSHLDLPIDGRPLRDIEREDLVPFEYLIQKDLRAVMAAHITYPEVDALPADFSKRWLKDILRTQLKFSGAVFSDDLNMAGAAVMGDPLRRIQSAREAGCDFILYCNDRQAVLGAINQLDQQVFSVPENIYGLLTAETPKTFSAADLGRRQSICSHLMSLTGDSQVPA